MLAEGVDHGGLRVTPSGLLVSIVRDIKDWLIPDQNPIWQWSNALTRNE